MYGPATWSTRSSQWEQGTGAALQSGACGEGLTWEQLEGVRVLSPQLNYRYMTVSSSLMTSPLYLLKMKVKCGAAGLYHLWFLPWIVFPVWETGRNSKIAQRNKWVMLIKFTWTCTHRWALTIGWWNSGIIWPVSVCLSVWSLTLCSCHMKSSWLCMFLQVRGISSKKPKTHSSVVKVNVFWYQRGPVTVHAWCQYTGPSVRPVQPGPQSRYHLCVSLSCWVLAS